MTASRRALQGEGLYTDIVEVNLPQTILLLTPPVLMSDLLRISDADAVTLFVWLATAVATMWHLALVGTPSLRRLHLAIYAILLAAALLVVPASDFGQREHLMVIVTLPLMAVVYRRLCGIPVMTRTALAAGAVAGVGLAIKPHFLLIWVALIGIDSRGQSAGGNGYVLRPESLATAAVLAVFLAMVILFYPSYVSLITDLSTLYGEFRAPRQFSVFVVLYGLALAVLFAGSRFVSPRARNLASVYMAVGTASLVMAVVQAKGWRYHALPLIITTILAWGVVVGDAMHTSLHSSERSTRLRNAVVAALLAAVAYPVSLSVSHSLELARRQGNYREWMAREVLALHPKSILVLADRSRDAYPLINAAGASSPSPFPSLWWIRAIYASGDEPVIDGVRHLHVCQERRLKERLITAFVADPPDLVMVDTVGHARYGNAPFPYLEYLKRDARFASAWSAYERFGGLDKFALWRRKEFSAEP